MKRLLFCAVLLGVALLSAQEKKQRLAVLEIEDRTGALSKELMVTASDYLRARLVAVNSFLLVPKDHVMRAVIKEQKKESWRDCYDPACRVDLGHALAADTVLASMVMRLGDDHVVTAELVDIAKEVTVKGVSVTFDGSEEGFKKVLDRVADRLAGKKPEKVPATPAGKVDPTEKLKGSVELQEKPKVERSLASVERKKPDANTYDVRGDVIIDRDTGYSWQRAHGGPLDLEKARSFCDDLVLGGFTDWRVPTISELRTLIIGCPNTAPDGLCPVDDACAGTEECREKLKDKDCACKAHKGPGEKGSYWKKGVWKYSGGKYDLFWSRSLISGPYEEAWGVLFSEGIVTTVDVSGRYYVRCVR
ncbi:MAG TPA: DUF1566 domain-containing protein [bacterium]|nr:DUF1566 domain-containing protein [bacterium]